MMDWKQYSRFLAYLKYIRTAGEEPKYIEIDGIRYMRVPKMSNDGKPLASAKEIFVSDVQSVEKPNIRTSLTF